MGRTLVQTLDARTLNPVRGKRAVASRPFDAKLVISRGQALGMVTASAVNHKQSITATSGSAGSAVFDYDGQRFTLAYNATPAAAQAILEALPNIGVGNVAVTSSGASLDAAALIVEFKGRLGGLTQPLILLVSNGITGATPTIATTQTPVPGGRMKAWNPARLADPTTGPTVTAETGGGMPVGTYLCQMAWITAQGETLPSQAKSVVVPDATNDRVRFAAITSGNVPAGATGIKYYLNGILAATVALSSGAVPQTDIDALPTSGQGTGPVAVNTAFTATDGSHILRGFALRDLATDNYGRVYTATEPHFDIGVPGKPEGEIVIGGTFAAADLVGITGYETLMVDQLAARAILGAVGATNAEYWFGPEGD
jgi:hypothetical protein